MYELNYDEMYFLDAEDLGEGGIAEAYEELKPGLLKFVAEPALVKEHKGAAYSVTSQGKTFNIYGPGLEDDELQSWGRAAHALFTIVNMQLKNQDTKLYGINGGNDLGGIFLTTLQFDAARNKLKDRSDWPYIVNLQHPSYGHLSPSLALKSVD